MEKQLEDTQKQAGNGRRRRLVLFPVPLQGHINPMLQLANILHSKGFSIAIVHTTFNSPNQSNYPHFTFRPISHVVQSGASGRDEVGSFVDLITAVNEKCAQPFRDCLGGLLSEEGEEAIACIITDAHWHFTQAIADEFKLPRMVLRTGSPSSLLAFAALPLLSQKGYLSNSNQDDSKLESLVQELPTLKCKDFLKIIPGNLDENFEVIHNIVKGVKVSSGIIWNTFRELEEPEMAKIQQDFSIPSFPIGPFHKYFLASSSSLLEQDQTSISWLGMQKPKSVIYVSFGSIAVMEEAEFLEMAWGIANSMQPFLWVVRPGIVRGTEWLESLPDGFLEGVDGRGHIVKWAPQQEVLAHPATGGFWTHCGWNSTLEGICEGVPMICSPCFGDQPVNARYVSDVWRVGVQLENGVERGEIKRAINRVMVGEERKEMQERMMCLKEKVNLCLKHGGSSNKSLESLIDYILSF